MRATEVYSDYIIIAWDEPETDGGCPITEYKVEKCDAVKQAFFSAGPAKTPKKFKMSLFK